MSHDVVLLREAFLGYLATVPVDVPCTDWFGHWMWKVSAVDQLGLQLSHECDDREFPDQPELTTTRVVNIPAGLAAGQELWLPAHDRCRISRHNRRAPERVTQG